MKGKRIPEEDRADPALNESDWILTTKFFLFLFNRLRAELEETGRLCLRHFSTARRENGKQIDEKGGRFENNRKKRNINGYAFTYPAGSAAD